MSAQTIHRSGDPQLVLAQMVYRWSDRQFAQVKPVPTSGNPQNLCTQMVYRASDLRIVRAISVYRSGDWQF